MAGYSGRCGLLHVDCCVEWSGIGRSSGSVSGCCNQRSPARSTKLWPSSPSNDNSASKTQHLNDIVPSELRTLTPSHVRMNYWIDLNTASIKNSAKEELIRDIFSVLEQIGDELCLN